MRKIKTAFFCDPKGIYFYSRKNIYINIQAMTGNDSKKKVFKNVKKVTNTSVTRKLYHGKWAFKAPLHSSLTSLATNGLFPGANFQLF